MTTYQKQIYHYFEIHRDLRVLFIFDPLENILSDLHDAIWDEGYRFEVFDGRWFTVKYNLDNAWKDDKVVLLFKQLKPENTATMLEFPLLDVLCANMDFCVDDYEKFMQQYNIPAAFIGIVKPHIAELQLEKYNRIIKPYFEDSKNITADIVHRTLLSGYLNAEKLLNWESIIIRYIILGLDSEVSKRNTFYNKLKINKNTFDYFQNKLNNIFGVCDDVNAEVRMERVAQSLLYNAITQLLPLEGQDNYRELKITNTLAIEMINHIIETAQKDRYLKNNFFDALTQLTIKIKTEEIINCYGADNNYYYLPIAMTWNIIKHLLQTKLYSNTEEVAQKIRVLSFKVVDDQQIANVIEFVEYVSDYYIKEKEARKNVILNIPEIYIEKYTTEYYQLDTNYRNAIEIYCTLKTENYPLQDIVFSIKQKLDEDYADWTNKFNSEWIQCLIDTRTTFNTLSIKKQYHFFKNERIANVKQTFIVCDALRYEIAQEIIKKIAEKRHVATLDCALAMMPTETKYTKTALLPHEKLSFKNNEMEVDGKVLVSIEQRSVQLQKYQQKSICVTYDSVMSLSTVEKRELFKNNVVYIFYDAIDNIGHGQNAKDITAVCQKAIEEISNLIIQLHSSLGMANVTLTSDHGFLFNDIVFEEKDKHTIENRDYIERKSRYFISNEKKDMFGIVQMPFSDISAINDSNFVGFPIGTNRLAAQGGDYNFTHGGATLQEMIIPIIRSSRRETDTKEKVTITLLDRTLRMTSSRLNFTIIQNNAISMSIAKREIVCAIYEGDRLLTQEKIYSIDSDDATDMNKRTYNIDLTLNQHTSANILELRVYDREDRLNPLIKERVINNTLIEQDF